MVRACTLLDWNDLVYLPDHSALFHYSWSNRPASNERYHWNVSGRRRLLDCIEHVESRHCERSTGIRTSRHLWTFSALVFLWSHRRRSGDDDSLRVCRYKKYYSPEGNGKPCVVVNINCIYHYNASAWAWDSKCICWH